MRSLAWCVVELRYLCVRVCVPVSRRIDVLCLQPDDSEDSDVDEDTPGGLADLAVAGSKFLFKGVKGASWQTAKGGEPNLCAVVVCCTGGLVGITQGLGAATRLLPLGKGKRRPRRGRTMTTVDGVVVEVQLCVRVAVAAASSLCVCVRVATYLVGRWRCRR